MIMIIIISVVIVIIINNIIDIIITVNERIQARQYNSKPLWFQSLDMQTTQGKSGSVYREKPPGYRIWKQGTDWRRIFSG